MSKVNLKINKWSPLNEINSDTVNIKNWSKNKILNFSLNELIDIRSAIIKSLSKCKKAAEIIIEKAKKGGRIITVGAGGSGVAGMSVMREIPQNHRKISPKKFFYQIAGDSKILNPLGCEEFEDDFYKGVDDIKKLKLNKRDLLILISATGRTPYTLGAASFANQKKIYTVGIICQKSELINEVNLPILIEVGPEIFFGATCEKAATAQKHVLDMIMNVVVVGLGVTNKNVCLARLVHNKARIRNVFLKKNKIHI